MESGCRFRNDRHSLAGSGALNLNTVDRQDKGTMAGAVDLKIALNRSGLYGLSVCCCSSRRGDRSTGYRKIEVLPNTNNIQVCCAVQGFQLLDIFAVIDTVARTDARNGRSPA